jgi:flagellar export protein FliJ
VKRFVFALERIRQWRIREYEVQEEDFRRLLAEQDAVVQAARQLEAAERQACQELLSQAAMDAESLHSLERWRSYSTRESARLKHRARQMADRIRSQQGALARAYQKVQSLNLLREKQEAAWRAALDREEEKLVQELVVARWRSAASD